MTNDQYLISFITKSVKETEQLGAQCVAMNKHHAKSVYMLKLWSFNWSARLATYALWWTYNPNEWIKLEIGKAPLLQWDHLIQDFGKHWHIGVVWRADAEWYYLLEQNNWELDKKYWERGDGDGKRNDAILIRYYRRQERPILMAFRSRVKPM